jgi:D-hydroxyproline dehydrogenase subunit beta
LVLGDSHEYDDTITPFDRTEINDLVLAYLRTFFDWDGFQIAERWHGIYLKSADRPYQCFSPERDVTVVSALGGHGMTLAFGLAEEIASMQC